MDPFYSCAPGPQEKERQNEGGQDGEGFGLEEMGVKVNPPEGFLWDARPPGPVFFDECGSFFPGETASGEGNDNHGVNGAGMR